MTFFCGRPPGCHCDENGRMCEWPCWQRLGLTATPCCPACKPLPAPVK